MKKEMCLFAAVAVGVFTGCNTVKRPAPAAPEIVSMYSIIPANIAPATTTQGPVSSFKPIYTVDTSKRISATATGKSEQEAKESAISNAIINNKCDDIFVNKIVFNKWNNGNYDCAIEGFAISIVNVEEIKTGIYEKASDGTLKRMDKLEHKLVYIQPSKIVIKDPKTGKPVAEKDVPGHWEYTPIADPAAQAPSAHAAKAPAKQMLPALPLP